MTGSNPSRAELCESLEGAKESLGKKNRNRVGEIVRIKTHHFVEDTFRFASLKVILVAARGMVWRKRAT